VAFRDVTPERMRRPLSVLVVNWRKIPITLKSSPPLVWFVAEHRSNDAGVRVRPSLINDVQEVVVVAS
jgi:hypothetical protein